MHFCKKQGQPTWPPSHKSMKRKPKAYNEIIIIWKDGNISIEEMAIDEHGQSYFWANDYNLYDWSFVAPLIKQWAYVDRYFEKELK